VGIGHLETAVSNAIEIKCGGLLPAPLLRKLEPRSNADAVVQERCVWIAMSGIIGRDHGAGVVAEIVIDEVARAATCAVSFRAIACRSLRIYPWRPRHLLRFLRYSSPSYIHVDEAVCIEAQSRGTGMRWKIRVFCTPNRLSFVSRNGWLV